MVYIFGGIDFPVFELLFVLAILQFIGLGIIIVGIINIVKQLRNLGGMLSQETTDLQEFDQDVKLLEEYEGNTKNKRDLVRYVKENLEKGFTWEQIRKPLLAKGWKKEDLDIIYKSLK